MCSSDLTPLNDGSRDWNLETIQPFSNYSPPVAAADDGSIKIDGCEMTPSLMLRHLDMDNLLATAASLMLTDGEMAPAEYQLLKDYAAARHYDEKRLQCLIESIKEHTLEITLPEERENQEFFLRCLIRMSLADGKVTAEEQKLLSQIAAEMNLTDYELKLKINQERALLYRLARNRK